MGVQKRDQGLPKYIRTYCTSYEDELTELVRWLDEAPYEKVRGGYLYRDAEEDVEPYDMSMHRKLASHGLIQETAREQVGNSRNQRGTKRWMVVSDLVEWLEERGNFNGEE